VKTGLKITGFKEMDLALIDLGKVTAKRTADRAMKKALQPVADAANGMLPKGMPPVIVAKKLNKNQSRQARGLQTATERNFFVGSPSPRAHLEEFGTGPRFHRSGKFTGSMSARPFMRPAWDQTRQQVLELLSAELASEIQKSLGRRANAAAKAGR
jgi:HK97 gp10 family phage protein